MIEVERIAEKIGKNAGFKELVFSQSEIDRDQNAERSQNEGRIEYRLYGGISGLGARMAPRFLHVEALGHRRSPHLFSALCDRRRVLTDDHPRPNISTRNRKVIARMAIAMPSG